MLHEPRSTYCCEPICSTARFTSTGFTLVATGYFHLAEPKMAFSDHEWETEPVPPPPHHDWRDLLRSDDVRDHGTAPPLYGPRARGIAAGPAVRPPRPRMADSPPKCVTPTRNNRRMRHTSVGSSTPDWRMASQLGPSSSSGSRSQGAGRVDPEPDEGDTDEGSHADEARQACGASLALQAFTCRLCNLVVCAGCTK